MKIVASCKKVSDMLKIIVNQNCEDGFKWYPEVKETNVSMFDLTEAIRVLDAQDDKEMEIVGL